MQKNEKIFLAVMSERNGVFNENKNDFSGIEIANNYVVGFDKHSGEDISRKRRIALNILEIKTKDNCTYYAMTPSKSRFISYLAISDQKPVEGMRYECKRLLYSYGSCYEDSIITTPVKRATKIAKNIYKVKTNHTYYVYVD